MKYWCSSILVFLFVSCGVDDGATTENEQTMKSADMEEYYSAQLTNDSTEISETNQELEVDIEPAEEVFPPGIGYAPDVENGRLIDEEPMPSNELAASYVPLPKCEACICGAVAYPHEIDRTLSFQEKMGPCISNCGFGAVLKYFNLAGPAVVAAKAKCNRYIDFINEEKASNWKGACFWIDRDFRGARKCYSVGNYAWIGHDFNDKVSSMILYGGARANLYEHIDFGGKKVEIPSDRYNYGYRDLRSSDEVISRMLPRHDSMSSFKIY